MPKTMIFLFDGTANDATQERFSNVYAINQLIADRKEVDGDITTQITFYLPGVGTKFTVRKSGIPFLGPAKKIRPVLFGDGIEQMILRAYVNLSANYHADDEIVLIGFSRGAVAARVFSRLISDFGILSSEMLLHLDKLWNEFVVISREKNDAEYFRKIERLRRDLATSTNRPVFHRPAVQPIKLLGVFDTVAGPLDNRIMKNIELRDLYPASGVQHVVHLLSMHEIRQEFSLKRFERREGRSTIREMWLPGVHSDVGGGYVDNLISNISLLTMADLLQSLGKVALQKDAYKKTRSEVKESILKKRLVVNAEPLVGLKEKRDIRSDDEIHPLHFYLLGKNVIWKNDQSVVPYENRIGRSLDEFSHDNWFKRLDRRFKQWVHIREVRTQ
jgi:uncharacterized protein (DUF2235 family)